MTTLILIHKNEKKNRSIGLFREVMMTNSRWFTFRGAVLAGRNKVLPVRLFCKS